LVISSGEGGVDVAGALLVVLVVLLDACAVTVTLGVTVLTIANDAQLVEPLTIKPWQVNNSIREPETNVLVAVIGVPPAGPTVLAWDQRGQFVSPVNANPRHVATFVHPSVV
jgi:hypothetical protein